MLQWFMVSVRYNWSWGCSHFWMIVVVLQMSLQVGTMLYWLKWIQKCKVDSLLSVQLIKSIYPTLVCLWGSLKHNVFNKIQHLCCPNRGIVVTHFLLTTRGRWKLLSCMSVFPYCLTAACSIKRIIEYPASKNHVKLCPQNLKLFFSSPLAFSLPLLFLLASQTSSCLRIFKRVEK